MKPFLALIISILFSIFIISCDNNRLYEKNKEIENGVWNVNDKKKFDVEIKDTSIAYNFFVNIRNSGTYQYSNIYLFMDIIYPDNKKSKDTIECILADDKGKWYGKGLGDIKDNKILIAQHLKFHKAGIYSFIFEQAMRNKELKGIYDIGIRIEKIQ